MYFLEAVPRLGKFILFDFSFLKKAAVDQKRKFERNAIDTLKIARKYLADLEHRSLDYLCGYYQIPHRAHRALEDAEATHFLYLKLAELFDPAEGSQEISDQAAGGSLFTPVPLHYRVKRDTPATRAQKEQLYRLMEQHKIKIDADVERMTRSEASRFADKIRSNPALWAEGGAVNQAAVPPDAAE